MSDVASSAKTLSQGVDIVLEGGGVRGIGHVGALSVLEERRYTWGNIAGTPAGAFVAALMAANYSAQEMDEIMRKEVNFSLFAQDKGLNGFFLVEGVHLLRPAGLHTGSYIESFIREKLLAAKPKPISTFKDLIVPGREDEPRDSIRRYRLTVIASDISQGLLLRLPQDMLKFGLNPEDLGVALAVRMSASIPFFFLPIKQPRQDGENDLVVDGGLLSNFPVGIFDVPGEPQRPTFGLRLVDSPPTSGQSWPIKATYRRAPSHKGRRERLHEETKRPTPARACDRNRATLVSRRSRY